MAKDCPISNRYVPEIRRLAAEFSSKSIRFWLVHPDADESAEAIKAHAREYALTLGILRDPKHDLVHRAQVRVTPEAAVFLPNRRLVYHGRIDNWYVELGQSRPAATEHDLKNTLQAILQGRPVPTATTRAIGCSIEPPQGSP